MPLRGVKPHAVEKRLKAFFFGGAGVGKTTAAISMPRPYLIDCERGAENEEYVLALDKVGGEIFQTADFDEVVGEVTTLLTENHEFRTVIIDPLTVVYNDLLDKAARSLATREDPEGMAFGRHKVKADRQLKHLLNLLLRLDMNVIITAHAKKVWGAGMTDLGNTFDCYAKLDHLFDLVFEIQKRGNDRVGIVKKTRVGSFKDGEVFPFDYGTIADKYGREILERAAQVQALATAEQVTELQRLTELLKVPEEVTDKWLDKAKAETFAEMPADAAQACIDYLAKQIKGAA